MSTIETILSIGMGLISLACTAGLPWLFMTERRLAHIEAALTLGHDVKETIHRHSDLIRKHDRRLMAIEQELSMADRRSGEQDG